MLINRILRGRGSAVDRTRWQRALVPECRLPVVWSCRQEAEGEVSIPEVAWLLTLLPGRAALGQFGVECVVNLGRERINAIGSDLTAGN